MGVLLWNYSTTPGQASLLPPNPVQRIQPGAYLWMAAALTESFPVGIGTGAQWIDGDAIESLYKGSYPRLIAVRVQARDGSVADFTLVHDPVLYKPWDLVMSADTVSLFRHDQAAAVEWWDRWFCRWARGSQWPVRDWQREWETHAESDRIVSISPDTVVWASDQLQVFTQRLEEDWNDV